LQSVFRKESGADSSIEITDVTSQSTIDTLYVTFGTPVTGSGAGADTLFVSFNSKLLGTSHTFDAFLYNDKGNDGAGAIKVWENKELGLNTVMVNKLMKGILTDVKAVPEVFTPNGDNKNDFTVIEFTLAKVETTVKVKIYNTAGNLKATICNKHLVSDDYRVEPGAVAAARDLPGYWNGEDDNGDLVPPGIYIYQVVADTDEGDEIEGGTVVVAY